jgi:hypothetical protein
VLVVVTDEIARKRKGTPLMRASFAGLSRTVACAAAFVAGVAFMPFGKAAPLSPALIYGVTVDNDIKRFDTQDQSFSFVATSLSTGVKANGFATDRIRNHLFYFGSNGDLYYYTTTDGSAGTVAPASTFGNVTDFPPEDASFYNGAFWYIGKGDNYNNKLYQVPMTYTGNVPSFSGTPTEYQLSASGSTTGMAFGDIAIHRDTGILYGSTTPGSGGLFFTLDMNSISSGTTNPLNVITTGNPISLQLAFSEDFSTLYGQEYRFDSNDPTNPALTSGVWYTVDTTSGTYNSISVTTSPGMRDLAGVAAVPEPGTFLLATVGFAVALAWNRKPVLKAARST